MNKSDLRNKLDLLGIDTNAYSLDGELLPDRIVLYNSYEDWEVFYLDERGKKNDKMIFHSEGQACEYIFEIFKESKQIEEKYLK